MSTNTKDFRKVAKKFIDNGYSVIPVNQSKNPAIKGWLEYQDRAMSDSEIEKYFKNCWGLGFVCGNYSRTIGLDWDTKYFLDENLYDEIKKKVPKTILQKMYVQSTQSGGWHWIFKVPVEVIKGNQKLALRHTTSFEKDITYREAYRNPKTRDKALKIALADACRVMVETREHGGYVLIAPSEGYKHVYGKIGTLTLEEYELLIEIVRSYNEYLEEETKHKLYDDSEWEMTPFQDYSDNGDILGLLLEHGWSESDFGKPRGNSVRLTRPGSPNSGSSALLDMRTGIFNCFSTSTIFETGKGYIGASVYNILECEGDWSKTFKSLVAQGYGKK
ncbi:bifunctional DNA primase/polymerase [Cellulophaga phage phi4:1]|uniref:Bifunctional DNA primase/polymerase n=5 Tax=Lightbulbvirus TaxID=1918522 RepID=A0A0S2MWC8_9CAUD|nr:DNA polymerase/primase [Cellulophaga phage phi4:1]YP_008241511.1 DNA polymerase/primase [Cellulophaga phage phi17:2]ALO80025.1 bifunctional DNA primase/polymerase [Cellulophaga phage phi4:1_13]ALO80222.1 bifunctional DNA primase/polymerase [Cellulophaga phage phi4:1_18]ALO80419.1 bifunctional DNA primase/polymerase [Cellulophaga phage phi17:2_18]AGO47549.1 bifunctional DNA primase/polymerase [Cellulophaga phage phi17:2]AGO49429.1 bifunctional DNA primase/polymerase [Cellulophaga phage phi4